MCTSFWFLMRIKRTGNCITSTLHMKNSWTDCNFMNSFGPIRELGITVQYNNLKSKETQAPAERERMLALGARKAKQQ